LMFAGGDFELKRVGCPARWARALVVARGGRTTEARFGVGGAFGKQMSQSPASKP